MKTSNATLAVKNDEEDGFVTFVMAFQLHSEDVDVVKRVIKPELDSTLGKEHDLADVLLACLTYGIHKAYENAEGVPWTLRMDRKKNHS